MSRFSALLACVAISFLTLGVYSIRTEAAETVWFTLPVTAGVTTTTVTIVPNVGGDLVRLWADNDYNTTATLTFAVSADIYTTAPVLLSSTIPSPQVTWVSPAQPIPNRMSVQATFIGNPSTSGVLGVLMLVDRPKQE
jgi:hypothetical protein